MQPYRPEFVPDPSLSREEMVAQQERIADAATFTDAFDDEPFESSIPSQPTIAGVDQGFDGDDATSAIVVLRGDEVIERVHATVRTEIPYIPGLLSFREGGAVLAAFERLESRPDLVLVDGSGRIHFREAGLATHVGVTLDVPTVGVIKNLLCGRPRRSLVEPLDAGERVAIEADEDVTAPDGTVIGYAVQTRQYDSPNRHVNPVYVSPGHRVSAETAVDIVVQQCRGYKLPEPIRLADSYVGNIT